MLKVSILNKIEKIGLVAVVRGNTAKEAKSICNKLIKGGIKAIEVTFTIPNASKLIQELVEEKEDILVGAGTVLDDITARIAIMNGAKFVVSPVFDKKIAKICNLYQIPYLAGCMTVNEMKKALEYGVDIVKLFPGSAYGSSIIKAFKAPLPQVNIMPTGGVNLENMKDWFNAGVIAVGVGGNLVSGNNIEEVAKSYIKELTRIRGTK